MLQFDNDNIASIHLLAIFDLFLWEVGSLVCMKFSFLGPETLSSLILLRDDRCNINYCLLWGLCS